MVKTNLGERRPPSTAITPICRTGLALLVFVSSFLISCTETGTKQARLEAPPPSIATPSPTAPAQQTPEVGAPDLSKVQEAVRRVFKDRVTIDTTHKPNFIAGDFNGDLSLDIAVAIKPADGKLSEINE